MAHYEIKNYYERFYWKNLDKKTDEKQIFIESQFSREIKGELYYSVLYILKNYKDFKIALSINSGVLPKELLKYKHRFIIFKRNSKKYYQYLSIAKFILIDITLAPSFIKKEGQILINICDNIPIKKTGTHWPVKNQRQNISNIQKNFMFADYIILRNEWEKNTLGNSYMIPNVFERKSIFSSGLKNKISALKSNSKTKILFNYSLRLKFKKDIELYKKEILKLENVILKTIIKEKINPENFEFKFIVHRSLYSKELIKWMTDELKFIRPSVDTEVQKELINSDIFISDLTSMIFDAAYHNKRIVIDKTLFDYYNKEKMIYEDIIEDLSILESGKNIEEVIKLALNGNSNTTNYEKLNEKFNPSHSEEKNWLDELLKEDGKLNSNPEKKEEILIYPGTLALNGITTSFKNTLEMMLRNGSKVTVWAPKSYINQTRAKELYDEFSEYNFDLISSSAQYTGSIIDHINRSLFFKYKSPLLKRRFSNKMGMEFRRTFPNDKFKKVIQFSGYEWYINELLSTAEAEKIVYVHNDMNLEFKLKRNFFHYSLKNIYNSADKIAFVSKGLSQAGNLLKIQEKNKHKFIVIENPMPQKKDILEKANETSIDFFDLKSKISKEDLISKINDKNVKKFISIGRIGALQKNHYGLIKIFEEYKKKNKDDSILLILGGLAKKDKSYFKNKKTKKMLDNDHKEDLIIAKSKNVYNIINKCNAFLLPSLYEGQPMVVMEAASVGTPVITSEYSSLKEQSLKYGHSKSIDPDEISKWIELMESSEVNSNKFDIDDYNESIEETLKKYIY